MSAGFLFHLCVAARLLDAKIEPSIILEIGGGYGALARVLKSIRPGLRYVILDLPESLYFSSTFLRLNFPEARTVYVTEKGQLTEPADFVFVPAARVDWLSDLTIDLIINVASLGEMTQSAVDRYMQLVNSDRVSWFYGINRFGQHRAAGIERRDVRKATSDTADLSMWFDPHWTNEGWSFLGDNDGFAQIEPIMPPYLEVLMKRIAKASRNPEQARADALIETADGKIDHRALWNAAWLSPKYRAHYGHILRGLGFVEADQMLREKHTTSC